jgi:3',5'-cyclic AMP phosphodiesterase CpdA
MPPSWTLLHLSDLHLPLALEGAKQRLFLHLEDALRAELQRRGRPADLVVVTGDVFDSSDFAPEAALASFGLFARHVRAAVGEAVPLLVQPGNHDRRRIGLFRDARSTLFAELGRRAGPNVHVYGNAAPFFAEIVPRAIHGLPLHIVTYDTTVLERGLISAGGVIRREDLLQIAAELRAQEREGERLSGLDVAPPDAPLLVLMHHHLVPTPLTDVGKIEIDRLPPLLRWPIAEALPRLVAHADREELMMTALGAGTALSTLHSLGRAVVVLHGHKHYPTARLLPGLRSTHGDIALGSAGSAGTVERFRPTDAAEGARIWPSFNVVTLARRAAPGEALGGTRAETGEAGRETLTIECVAFSDKKRGKAPSRRLLLRATRAGRRWTAEMPEEDAQIELPIALNESVMTLRPSGDHPADLWDIDCARTVLPAPGAAWGRYREIIEGLQGATLRELRGGEPWGASTPLDGGSTVVDVIPGETWHYRLARATCRTLAGARRHAASLDCYDWVGLFCRHGSEIARLVLRGLPPGKRRAFGSATDLATGEERECVLREDDGALVLEEARARPLSLLRIYWPLEG